MDSNITNALVFGVILIAFGWFARNPLKAKTGASTKTFLYVLYILLGLGIGIVVGGFITVFLVSSYGFEGAVSLGRVAMIVAALLGAACGALLAYRHPVPVTLSPSEEQGLQKLTQATQESKNVPASKNSFVPSIVTLVLCAGIFALNYFHGIYNNTSPSNYLFIMGATWLAFAWGVIGLFYTLFKRMGGSHPQ